MLSAGLTARSQNTFWHQGSDWRCCTCQRHFPHAVLVLWVRCHMQRVHTAVTLFLLIYSPPGSSGERVFGRQQGQDCHWCAREQVLHLPALFPQPLAERVGREGKKLLEDPPDLVTALQPDPVPLHLSSLPALLMMTHRKDVSQAAIPFQGVPQLPCLGLGQENRQTIMCRS